MPLWIFEKIGLVVFDGLDGEPHPVGKMGVDDPLTSVVIGLRVTLDRNVVIKRVGPLCQRPKVHAKLLPRC